MKKRFIIEKESTATSSSYVTDSTFITETTITDEYYYENGNDNNFINIKDADYKKPITGSMQDSMTKEEIIKRLENCIPLKTMEEKKVLTKLPFFRTWIRYYNINTKQFRVGGVLTKVVYPDYMVLVNLNNKVSWSVQLKDVIVYITHPAQNEKIKEKKIKDKLYDLYKRGKLSRKD